MKLDWRAIAATDFRRDEIKERKQAEFLVHGRFSFKLIERHLPHRKFVEFTEMRGRTVEKIEFYTVGEYHSISIDFQDKTALHLRIDPCFILNADFADIKTGNIDIIREWPPIHSTTNP